MREKTAIPFCFSAGCVVSTYGNPISRHQAMSFTAFLNDCAAPHHDNAIGLSPLPNFLASRLASAIDRDSGSRCRRRATRRIVCSRSGRSSLPAIDATSVAGCATVESKESRLPRRYASNPESDELVSPARANRRYGSLTWSRWSPAAVLSSPKRARKPFWEDSIEGGPYNI
jgi:hypothetical protein